MVILPLDSNCWRVTTVTGAGVVRSLRRMREPVTTTSSVRLRRSAGGALVGADGSTACASAGAEAAGAGAASVCEGVDGGVCAAAMPADSRTNAAIRDALIWDSPRVLPDVQSST